MRYVLLITIFILAPSAASAQAPPYQRTRSGASDWQGRGGVPQNWHNPAWGQGGFFNPYFAATPIVTGSYYQRPYPYHFDYYRNRWGAHPAGDVASPVYAEPDCPCAVPPPVEVVE